MKRFLQCTCLVLLLVLTLGLLISCGDKTELEQSMVTSVEIDKKATQIRVKAGLTEGDLETYRDNSIYNQKLYFTMPAAAVLMTAAVLCYHLPKELKAHVLHPRHSCAR